MTPSPRHENSVDRVKVLLREMGHEIWENTDLGGKRGYQLPAMICDDEKPRPFVVDCMARLNTGAMMAFEVDHHHPTTLVKMAMLARVGIVPVPVNPGGVDLWVKDPSLLQNEIAYRLKDFARKNVGGRGMAGIPA